MLEIKNLQVSYNGLPVLQNVNLSLAPGEALALVGESGAGKTTLGLSLMGLVEGKCTGEINYRGRNLLACAEKERRVLRGGDLAMVFQNVEDALHPLYTVSEQILEAILVHGGCERTGAAEKVSELLQAVGLREKNKAGAYPHQLSGGERQRALIAMALANDPGLLIFDEPTASLDALTRGDIIRLLKEKTMGKMSLVITHDLATAASLTDRMAVLYGGMVVECGPTAELLGAPRHPYTRGLLRSYPDMTATKDLQGIPGRFSPGVTGCPFHPRCTQRIPVCLKEAPEPLSDGPRLVACHRGGIVPLLQVKNCSKSFRERKVVQEVSLTLYEGETLALVGESGSGKTTLAKTIMGLYRPDEGQILLEGEDFSQKKEFYKKVQMVFQNPRESVSHRMTVYQAVKEPLDVQGLGDEEEKTSLVKQVLTEVELPDDDGFLKKYPHHLSGGEAQRVAIARALVLNPKVLIADEPTSALDASVQAKILRVLLNLQEKRGLAILLITHDLALARKVSDRVAVMLKGKIVEEGASSAVFSSPAHVYTRSLLSQASGLAAGSPGDIRKKEIFRSPLLAKG